MEKLKIKGKKYYLKTKWNEITIKEAEKIQKLNIPAKLMEEYKIYANDISHKSEEEQKRINDTNTIRIGDIRNSYTDEELNKEFPVFYANVIEILSDADREILEYTYADQRKKLYFEYLEGIVLGIFFKSFIDYVPKGIKKFKFKGKTYYLPKTLRIHNEDILMGREPIASFTESCDIQKFWKENQGEGIGMASTMIALYCRPKKYMFWEEKYNEDKVLERSEIFQELPMDIFLEVFFYIYELWGKYRKSILSYSLRQIQTLRQKVIK